MAQHDEINLETKSHDLTAIRDLLQHAFTPQELRRFCFDRPTLRPAVDYFGQQTSLNAMIDTVIDYCRKHALLPELLIEIRESNPRQYQRYEPEFRLLLEEYDPALQQHAAGYPAQEYNIAAIRDLVGAAFTTVELRRFCQDHVLFQPIVNHLRPSSSLEDSIDVVLEYCEKRDLL